jgi:hypothetical protein
MTTTLTIVIDFGDETDLQFLRPKLVAACDDVVAEFLGEGDEPARNDGPVEVVGWEVDDS